MMKVITYLLPDGSVGVRSPKEGSRIAHHVVTPDGEMYFNGEDFETSEHAPDDAVPLYADQFFRRWPVDGVTAVWAETEEKWLERLIAMGKPGTTDFQIIDRDSLPKDRYFRRAWRRGGNGCVVDMTAAVEVQKDRLRELRAPLLAVLDAEYMKALESGDTVKQAEVAAKKQALRDVTKDARIMTAKTPEALKAVIPEILK